MRRKNSAARRWLGALMIALAIPVVAQADECSQWNLAGTRTLVQKNGTAVNANFRLNGHDVEGSAGYTKVENNRGERVGTGLVGTLEGTFDGTHLRAQIHWSDGVTGVYEGKVAPNGRLSGTTYDRRRPDVRVAWQSPISLTCATAPPIKPVRTLGKRPGQPQPDQCATGYVWREAKAGDHVCVTPASRGRVAEENRTAAARRNPAGAYGPNTCVSGFVWREAFQGDTVCVKPERRDAVREENRLGASHRASS